MMKTTTKIEAPDGADERELLGPERGYNQQITATFADWGKTGRTARGFGGPEGSGLRWAQDRRDWCGGGGRDLVGERERGCRIQNPRENTGAFGGHAGYIVYGRLGWTCVGDPLALAADRGSPCLGSRGQIRGECVSAEVCAWEGVESRRIGTYGCEV